MDVRTALKLGVTQLREANIPSFTLAAELLLLHTLVKERTWLYAHPEELVSEADAQRFQALLTRRAAGDTHHAALRTLGNRLVGILHGCLIHQTSYDEQTAWRHPAERPFLLAAVRGALAGAVRAIVSWLLEQHWH